MTTDVHVFLQRQGYLAVKKIGRGSFGQVFLIRKKSPSESSTTAPREDHQHDSGATPTDEELLLVGKIVDVSSLSEEERNAAVREARLLARLQHPYIIRYQGSALNKNYLLLLMDYCSRGDLGNHIRVVANARKKYAESQIVHWLAQMALALRYLHRNRIMHRDVKVGEGASGRDCIGKE